MTDIYLDYIYYMPKHSDKQYLYVLYGGSMKTKRLKVGIEEDDLVETYNSMKLMFGDDVKMKFVTIDNAEECYEKLMQKYTKKNKVSSDGSVLKDVTVSDFSVVLKKVADVKTCSTHTVLVKKATKSKTKGKATKGKKTKGKKNVAKEESESEKEEDEDEDEVEEVEEVEDSDEENDVEEEVSTDEDVEDDDEEEEKSLKVTVKGKGKKGKKGGSKRSTK